MFGTPITDLRQQHFYVFPKPGPTFQSHMSYFLFFVQLFRIMNEKGYFIFLLEIFLYMVDKCNGWETSMWQQGAVTEANDPSEFTAVYGA